MRAKGSPRGARSKYVALMRGINVGGKNMLPMAVLVELFSELGCSDVCTYVQSGNVVFGATEAVAKTLPEAVAKVIERRRKLKVPVVLRSARELERVAAANPYLRAGVDPIELHVMFLADAPAKAAVAGLDGKRSPPDEFVVAGRDVYLRLPSGMARTKLSNAYFDSRLATVSTVRNWRTVLKLVEMTAE
jgi:uncharacterized protein (DUF1697 family)